MSLGRILKKTWKLLSLTVVAGIFAAGGNVFATEKAATPKPTEKKKEIKKAVSTPTPEPKKEKKKGSCGSGACGSGSCGSK